MSDSAELERLLAALAPEPGPEGAGTAAVAQTVRGYLEACHRELERMQKGGASGRQVNEAHSDWMDRLTRRLFERAESQGFAEGAASPDAVAMVAVGGYARREMSLCSDVDLLLLHAGSPSPYLTRIAERLQYWLWDGGLSVGCATRSVGETLDLARADITVFTAILDVRFLGGGPDLFHSFTEASRRELLADPAVCLDQWLEALRARHERFGGSLYLLQPNLKEGVGGLRDYHTAAWAMRAAHSGARGLDDLLHFGLLTELEMVHYRAALDFLWRVRNELHRLAKRRNDQMSFEHQERIAETLGYGESVGHGAALPVERFMGEYYRHARVIQHHSQLVIEQCQDRVRPAPAVPSPVREVEEGFRIANGRLTIPHVSRLRECPLRLLQAFEVAQRHDVPLSRTAERMIRENLALVDDALRQDAQASACFLRILDAERRVMRTLMGMNELGLLGCFLPEWDHIVCRWQHVLYHTYTVDVHSIFLVEELRRLWRGKYERALPALTELAREVDDRPVLFLACLLHDIGKGLGGDHSSRGADRARACVTRLGLDPARTERVVFLVRHHLLMSHLAQRRDLSDPRLLSEFARIVGDRQNLRNLYLLTFADMRASSPSAWTDWKGNLLREAFERTAELLETGTADPGKALEQIEARVERHQSAASQELRALGVAEAKVAEYFAAMPRRYFVSHTPPELARHALARVGFLPERLLAVAVRESESGVSELILWSRDVHGLYAAVTGTLTARGINILGSHVYTTRDGLALEVYRVHTPPGEPDERREQWTQFETALGRVLRGEVRVADLLRRRRRPLGALPPPSRRPPSVAISNEESHFYTIVDVSANDRLGLLYALTRTLTAHGLEIYLSKASTILDQVADTFYVKTEDGRKLTDPDRIAGLREALLESVREEGDGGDG